MAQMNFFPGYYRGILLEKAHIRDATFKITIPSLFTVKDQYEPNENVTMSLDKSTIANKNGPKPTSFDTSNVIIAHNHTDYTYRLRGDVFKKTMESTDGITEPRSGGSGSAAYESHDHTIKQPITLNLFTFENLNDVELPKGTEVFGFFINASMDRNAFAVTHIKGAIPLKKEDPEIYYKR